MSPLSTDGLKSEQDINDLSVNVRAQLLLHSASLLREVVS